MTETERLLREVRVMSLALAQIRRWDGFPPTSDGRPYCRHWGSKGERDFMRRVAGGALDLCSEGGA